MACLLVTGATGVVGSALVPELLRDPRASVVLLLRAQDAQDLGARLDRLHAWWRTVGHAVDATRVEALVGDVCQPLLGLEPACAMCSSWLHAAARLGLLKSWTCSAPWAWQGGCRV
jgi:thioester reductase-like protein